MSIAENVARIRSEMEAADEVRKSSRHYAKRQLTWFRRNKDIRWITRKADSSPEEILRCARQIIRESDN